LGKKGQCLIYPVRPIDCRTAKTKSPCGKLSELKETPNEIRLFCDQIVSDLIMEKGEEEIGRMEVIPLIGWPISEQLGKFFM
jgi:Fe-S-cluster containining protein